MPIADLDSGLHGLAGTSGAFDALVEFAAQYLIFGAVVVFALLWWRRDALRAGVAALAGALGGLAGGAIIGLAWDRPRPFVAGHYAPLVAHGVDASFPSDHLVVLGAFAVGAWLCWRPVGAALGVIALLLATARAITGIHYLTDLAGGFLIGGLLTLAAWWALTPLLPVLEAVDRRLAGLRLRPRAATSGPSPAGRGSATIPNVDERS